MALGKSALLELTEALGSADGDKLMRRLLPTSSRMARSLRSSVSMVLPTEFRTACRPCAAPAPGRSAAAATGARPAADAPGQAGKAAI